MEDNYHRTLTDADYQILADFRCALREFLAFSEEQARAAGITPQQHMLLLIVRGHRAYPKVSIGDIAQALRISHHGASLLVDRGVRRGLLTRREDPSDRRRALISLSAAGQNLLAEITLANWRELHTLENELFETPLHVVTAEREPAAE